MKKFVLLALMGLSVSAVRLSEEPKAPADLPASEAPVQEAPKVIEKTEEEKKEEAKKKKEAEEEEKAAQEKAKKNFLKE